MTTPLPTTALRPLVKQLASRWVVLPPAGPARMFVHVSDHDTWPEALAAAHWWAFWHAHELRALDVVGEHLIVRYLRAATWVHKHWGDPR